MECMGRHVDEEYGMIHLSGSWYNLCIQNNCLRELLERYDKFQYRNPEFVELAPKANSHEWFGSWNDIIATEMI